MRMHGLILFLLLVFSRMLNAQEVDFKKDMALVDGQEYCQVTEESQMMIKTAMTVYNLAGDELFYLKMNSYKVKEKPNGKDEYYSFYTLTNIATGEQIELEIELMFKKNLVKHLFQEKVINAEGRIDEAGFRKFAIKHGCNCTQELEMEIKVNGASAGVGVPSGAALVKRNRSAMIFVSGKEIRQDNTLIGTYTREQHAVSGTVKVYYSIYDMEGNLIAESVCTAFNPKSCETTTVKDNRTYTVSFNFNTDMEIVKAIARMLTDKLYL
ncbi:MAG: hypothetical protein K1X92_17865 [Bacteroidia bacterium]|nr:hypothetical protein [Bacteroidia bacterium]